MQTYTTQMDAARKGIITPQMEIVAKKEYRTTEEIRQWVAEGKVAIPANKHHECLNPEGVGSMLRTKINVNLGVSRDCKDYNVEMQKVMSAVNMGAEAIMDLSSHGNTQPFRQKLTHECPVMIGTVPVYDSVIHYQRDLAELTAQDFIDVVRLHAEDGVDFVTLHCGITRKTIEQIRKHKRKMNIVSRGGSLVFAWMSMTGNENPFYEHFDEICEICAEHDVTISLGDACRPGCLADATDVCQIEELVRLGELTKRAWAHNVQVMVEGPGHVPLNQVLLDGLMGVGVAAFILISGWGLVMDTLSPLLGESPSEDLVDHIEQKVLSYPGVLGMHDLMVHDYGPGHQFASLHVELPAEQDPLEAHDLIDNIERDFLKNDRLLVTIHYDPIVTDDPESIGGR